MRKVSYRTAANAAIFLVLWFGMGVIFLWTPVPGALGIGAELFVVWMMLSFLILAGTGVVFVLAAYNAAFPPGPPSAATAPQARPARRARPDARSSAEGSSSRPTGGPGWP